MYITGCTSHTASLCLNMWLESDRATPNLRETSLIMAVYL